MIRAWFKIRMYDGTERIEAVLYDGENYSPLGKWALETLDNPIVKTITFIREEKLK